MTTAISIEATGLQVQKQHTRILDDLAFTVRAGSITGLIGPSGSGKTTLLRAIVGVQKISHGTLTVLGKAAGAGQLRARIGYVTQSPAIYSDLTVWQNLRYFATLTRTSTRNAQETLVLVSLEDKKDQLVSSLSGGQKARVSLAIALLADAEVLVLDEPTVGLDPLLRQELWQLFASLAARGKTLLISSHVMDEAEKCDDLLLMREGRLLWNDSRERLLVHTHQTTVEGAFIAMITRGDA